MKIILTTVSPNIESGVDPRFGRGAYLLAVDTETLEWEAHPNSGVRASGGAGVQAAQFATDQHAEAVISGDFGPNAYNALKGAGIAMYLYGDSCTAQEAITRFKNGLLQQIGSPTRNDPQHGSKA
jgi:predicted Fe-Mo cluster-binding NifX family protein